MKATGIIRRIDELGRIVIPKEIRKNLRINEGENLEVFIDQQENIVLKKHSQIENIEDYAQNVVDAIYEITKKSILISDTSKFIAGTNNLKKEYKDNEISDEVGMKLKKKENIIPREQVKLLNSSESKVPCITHPIVVNGDVSGIIIIISEEMVEDDLIYAQIIARIIERNITNV